MLDVSLGREGADRLGVFLRLSLLLFLCLHLQYCCDFLVYLDYPIGYFYLDGFLKVEEVSMVSLASDGKSFR